MVFPGGTVLESDRVFLCITQQGTGSPLNTSDSLSRRAALGLTGFQLAVKHTRFTLEVPASSQKPRWRHQRHRAARVLATEVTDE